jgi:hypothetical protein
MKTLAFFTIHQAPHNTYTFRSLENTYNLEIFYLREKLMNYGWVNDDYFYPGKSSKNLVTYVRAALKTDFAIISGWNNYKHIVLILLLLLTNHKFAIYLDFNKNALRKFGYLKRLLLKKLPYVLITGVYGETFLKKYLGTKNITNFPYGIELVDSEKVNDSNRKRVLAISEGDKIRVFISSRFIDRKGYHLVYALIQYLKNQNKINEFKFVIAGNGPMLEEMKAKILLIDNSVSFLDLIDILKYKENLLMSDIYLHCSEFEPYGIPPVDAFVCKKEIVVTNKVYSIYDIRELGGFVHEFNYKKENELFEIFNKLIANKSNIYRSNKHISFNKNDHYLFRNKHLAVINEIFKVNY